MNVEHIKEVVPETLLSIQFDEFEVDEVKRIFDQWSDVVFLEEFFHTNYDDLNGDFYKMESVDEAVLKTLSYAKDFSKLLKSRALGENGRNLDDLFKPYNKHSTEKIRERSKARGVEPRSWLRLYAIRLDDNLFVITGGAIKLTFKMDRDHLEMEDKKMDIVAGYFKSEKIDSKNDYCFIDFNGDDE